jgi:hypothetical protein
MSTPTLSRPAWYPDLEHPGQQHYWDGQSWTAASEDANPVEDRQTKHLGLPVVAGVGLLVAGLCVVASGLWEDRTMSALLMGMAFMWGMSAGYVFAWSADRRTDLGAATNR